MSAMGRKRTLASPPPLPFRRQSPALPTRQLQPRQRRRFSAGQCVKRAVEVGASGAGGAQAIEGHQQQAALELAGETSRVDRDSRGVLRQAGGDEPGERPFDRFVGVGQPAGAARQSLGIGPVGVGEEPAEAGAVVRRIAIGGVRPLKRPPPPRPRPRPRASRPDQREGSDAFRA